MHERCGVGRDRADDRQWGGRRATIRFAEVGEKRVLLAYAPV
jgi:hypothetical protein